MPTTLPERPDYTSQRRSIFWIFVAPVLIAIETGLYLMSGNSNRDAGETNAGPSTPQAATATPATPWQAQTAPSVQ